MKVPEGRGGIALTHSQPQHYMEVSGQHHAVATLYPRGKDPPIPTGQEAGWASELVWTQRLEEKSSVSVRDRTPVVQSVVQHYTD
jgi:hypothetical protein